MLLNTLALTSTLLTAVAPFARAELHQSPTGVEYAKRFQPSAGVCYYVCPNYTAQEGDVEDTDVSPDQPGGVDSGTITTCKYTYTSTDLEFTYERGCVYDSFSGAGVGYTPGSDGGCEMQALTNLGPGTCNGGRRRRSLTKLEQVIRARQYHPARKTAGAR